MLKINFRILRFLFELLKIRFDKSMIDIMKLKTEL